MRHLLLMFCSTFATLASVQMSVVDAQQQQIDFNRDVRPILAENCFFCHGQDPNKREAGLRLDIESEALEAEAYIAGDPDNSYLIERIESDDASELMPPAESNRHLSDKEKKILRAWIKQGGKYQEHWAFTAPKRPVPPSVQTKNWVRNPIDQFVLAKLESEELSPSAEAERTTLIKRLYVDLSGLPPTPEQVQQFVADKSPDAYEKLVDQLLASPHYGERLAIPWLDAARYADSNGFQQDGDTWQWMWRDWLVRALNDDLPFDQLTIWMLAGDLLENATQDQKIASGFNRNHMLNGEGGAIAEEQRFVVLFDRMDTTSTTWLGLTMACAQCHDHKYDPISQKDYYSLMDAFNRVPESGTPQFQTKKLRAAKPYLEILTDENKRRIASLEPPVAEAKSALAKLRSAALKAWMANADNTKDLKDFAKRGTEILAIETAKRSDEQKLELTALLRKHYKEKVQPIEEKKGPAAEAIAKLRKAQDALKNYRNEFIARPMIMSDDKPRQTKILDRGEYLSPTKEVKFATPAFLPAMPKDAPQNRLGLAQWLVSPENPLTARVQVNRMWQYFFGSGIVITTEDMGVQSEFPIHGELLDWLAVEFREGGWSVKDMHRLIVTSATYRQASRITPDQLKADPSNRLYGRASRFRMPALILRDWALATSDLLNDKIGGVPVYPYQPPNVWESLAITKERDFTYPKSSGDDLYRRSLYSFWRRTVGPANMFDSSNRQSCRVRKSITSTPLHALTTLNDPTWVEAARVLAENCMTKESTAKAQLQFAFQKIMCRLPSTNELDILQAALSRQQEVYNDAEEAKKLISVGERPANDKLDPSKLAAMSAVCLGILNLDEALTRE